MKLHMVSVVLQLCGPMLSAGLFMPEEAAEQTRVFLGLQENSGSWVGALFILGFPYNYQGEGGPFGSL